jgi:hypothetical protein
LERLDSGVRLNSATSAFEQKWSSDDTYGQRSAFFSNVRDDWSGAGPCTSTFTSSNKNHVGAFKGLGNFFRVFYGGLTPDVRVATRAEPLSQFAAYIKLDISITHQECLGICIHRDEFDACQTRFDHSVQCVAATTAYADNFDHGLIVLGAGHWVSWCLVNICHVKRRTGNLDGSASLI